MTMEPSWANISKDFAESVGYIRQDLRWLQSYNSGLNYTALLLVGCGCEMLAAISGDKHRRGELIMQDLLPPGDWQLLAPRLYTALRDGLAHGFDTKHIEVDGRVVQIYISWSQKEMIRLHHASGESRIYVGAQPMINALCARIDELERRLKLDGALRLQFQKAATQGRTAKLNQEQAEAWRRLAAASSKPDLK